MCLLWLVIAAVDTRVALGLERVSLLRPCTDDLAGDRGEDPTAIPRRGWRVGTLARQLHVHRSVVRRVLSQAVVALRPHSR